MTKGEPDCVFCKIVKGTLESEIVKDYKEDNILVFKDHRPASDIHLLAIPKVRVRDMTKVDEKTKNLLVEKLHESLRNLQLVGVCEIVNS